MWVSNPDPLLWVEPLKRFSVLPKKGDIAAFSRTASGPAVRRRASWRYTADAVAYSRRRAAHAGRHDPGPGNGDRRPYPDPPGTREELTVGSFAAAVGRGITADAMVCRERRRCASTGNVERRPCQGPAGKSPPKLALWAGETAELTGPLGTRLLGSDSFSLGQELRFAAPVKLGDTIKVVVTCDRERD